ncbi:LysR family transcriptional regulator [Paraburkholderia sp. BL6669N2]|uniref:LysR family transcriptional regulator n=1 Tax=Paraburkholderia sp. BL6669N2 TaxID=1938807 RepID=UPI002162FB96|nr:LysR family transcriptional regulator [Paraburkholderia sp. BL6669N2]
MDPAQLPALMGFVSVARHGSFTRAAAETGVTASALSQNIRSLETQLNVRLFNRTTRRVALTEAGAQFLARVRPALGELEAAFEALDETRDQPATSPRAICVSTCRGSRASCWCSRISRNSRAVIRRSAST